jgi:hypothetical protein
MFDADVLTGMRIGPARDITRGIDATPRSIASPALSANPRRGRTPTPTTTISASIAPPLFSIARLPSIAVTVSPR